VQFIINLRFTNKDTDTDVLEKLRFKKIRLIINKLTQALVNINMFQPITNLRKDAIIKYLDLIENAQKLFELNFIIGGKNS
jgi:hypothetical protein